MILKKQIDPARSLAVRIFGCKGRGWNQAFGHFIERQFRIYTGQLLKQEGRTELKSFQTYQSDRPKSKSYQVRRL